MNEKVLLFDVWLTLWRKLGSPEKPFRDMIRAQGVDPERVLGWTRHDQLPAYVARLQSADSRTSAPIQGPVDGAATSPSHDDGRGAR
jgi:hypothetical protein